MKFIVNRASSPENAPVRGAMKESCQSTVFDSNPGYPRPERMVEWESTGYNHRMEGKYYVREVDDERWWINVDTLEELLGLIEPNTDGIIVSAGNANRYTDHPLMITIYDGYVE